MLGKFGCMMPKGLDNIINSLNREIAEISGNVRLGVLESTINVLGEALPETPLLTGNLRNSSYIDDANGKQMAYGTDSGKVSVRSTNLRTDMVTIGYRANYAIHVHEIKKQNYTTPGTGWKFLEKALKRNFWAILETIRIKAKIKK